MGFQDNSGDIIFDVVLTDEGRRALSDPTVDFKITKFKVSDDEINYGLFNLNTGSAYQDLQILQTPVFEAFTNNTSNMSSMLISYTQNDLLYLPVIELNEIADGTVGGVTARHSLGTFMVAVDQETEGSGTQTVPATALAQHQTTGIRRGFLFGNSLQDSDNHIRIDAGIDNSAQPPNISIDTSLYEDSYFLELDSRLGRIVDVQGNDTLVDELYTDDDNITVYRVSQQTNEGQNDPVKDNPVKTVSSAKQVIRGSRSTFLRFKVESSQELRQSNFYFTKFGSETKMEQADGTTPGSNNARIIDTLIKVTGVKTGYTLDIPVRFVKLKQ